MPLYEKYDLSTDFQDLLLASIIAHPEKFMHNAGTLNAAYFTGLPRVAAARAMFGYWKKNQRFPSRETLGQLIYDSIQRTSDEKEEGTIMTYVKRLLSLDTGDVNYVVERVIQFARERAVFIAIEKCYEAHKEGKVPEGGFCKPFEDALKIGQNLEDLGYRIQADGGDIKKIIDKVTAHEYGMATGFADFDRIWPFGWGPGWLVSILAPPKRFKSALCINLALNMIENQNSCVFYYPCEISQELAAIRCLTNLTSLSSNILYENKHSFADKALLEARTNLNSTLLIKGFAARTATISGDIRSHALTSSGQLGLKPRCIIIDFAETVKPSSDPKRTSEHRAQGEIYMEARALGHEFKCPVILPDRCNKETVGHRVPSMKSFQGSFEKAGIVDVAIGLCADDQEYLDHIIRYFVFLNRHGEAYQHFRGRVVPEYMQMTVDERIPYEPDEEEAEDNHPGRRKRPRAPRDVVED